MRYQSQNTAGLALTRPTDRSSGRGGLLYRLIAGVMALGCWLLLATAWTVAPAPEGLGSHEQLGLPVCGFYQRTGYPCPSCGMTTAFAWSVRGRFLQAVRVQPAGTLVALVCMLLAVASPLAAITGRGRDWLLYQCRWDWVAAVGAVVVLLSWGWSCLGRN